MMEYAVVRVEEERDGSSVFIQFPKGADTNPATLIWHDASGQPHEFESYGRLVCSSKPAGYTYWSDDAGIEGVNVISLV